MGDPTSQRCNYYFTITQQGHMLRAPRKSPVQDRWVLVLESGEAGVSSGD